MYTFLCRTDGFVDKPSLLEPKLLRWNALWKYRFELGCNDLGNNFVKVVAQSNQTKIIESGWTIQFGNNRNKSSIILLIVFPFCQISSMTWRRSSPMRSKKSSKFSAHQLSDPGLLSLLKEEIVSFKGRDYSQQFRLKDLTISNSIVLFIDQSRKIRDELEHFPHFYMFGSLNNTPKWFTPNDAKSAKPLTLFPLASLSF